MYVSTESVQTIFNEDDLIFHSGKFKFGIDNDNSLIKDSKTHKIKYDHESKVI